MSWSNFKQEWMSFIGALFIPPVIFPLIVTILLFVGAYFAPDPWSTILYIITTLPSSFAVNKFTRRYKLGMTKEEIILEDGILADALELTTVKGGKQYKPFIDYTVSKLRR